MNDSNIFDPNRLNDMDYLKEVATNFDEYECDVDTEAIYRYAQYLYAGLNGVGQDKDAAIALFARLFVHFYSNGELYYEDFDEETGTAICDCIITKEYKDIFLGAEYFSGYDNEIGPNEYLIEIARIIQKGIPGVLEADPERAFKLVEDMPPIIGMVGGMELVQMIHAQDMAKLFLGECYMYGIGTEQNLGDALANYLFYHTDHLAQKWHGSLITDEFDKLYLMIESMDDSTLTKVDLLTKYCALTVMTIEGIGCIPDQVKAMQYLIKARKCNEDIYKHSQFGFDDIHGQFGFDFKYFCRLLSFNAKPYEKDMVLFLGEHVYLGRYNNRAVSWKVLNITDGKALLLADEALESSHILGCRCMHDDWTARGIDYLVDIDSDMGSYLYDKEKGTGTCFYLTADMLEEYLPNPEDRICYYREQAYTNSTDGDSLNYNKLAPWWLLSNDDKGNETQLFVNIDGEIYESNYHRDFGIRPAMYVKVAN